MKRRTLSGVIIFLLICQVQAQNSLLRGKWSDNTAYTLKKGNWETGIIQPFRYGLTGRTELRTNLLLMPVLPNIGIKTTLYTGNELVVASEHAVSYPTLFLKVVSRKGIGGLISPQYDFPFLLAVNNSLITSKPVSANALLSIDVGLAFTIRGQKPDPQATIDLPFIYPRMAHYYQGVSIRTGLSYKGLLTDRLFYDEQLRLFQITRNSDNVFVENGGSLMWAVCHSLRLKGGYAFSWGKYPFGKHFQLWPTVDIVFGSNR
ncbi:MAG: hypothetical protein Q8914_02345 [Bacteroidota bacterium]|nr:hypothetical protein [Bacteroidota bacterium]